MKDKVVNIYNSMDKNTKKLMNSGIACCFILAIISSLFLLTYHLFYNSLTIYYIGFYLFKNSILFACTFFAFGIGFDKIKKDLF